MVEFCQYHGENKFRNAVPKRSNRKGTLQIRSVLVRSSEQFLANMNTDNVTNFRNNTSSRVLELLPNSSIEFIRERLQQSDDRFDCVPKLTAPTCVCCCPTLMEEIMLTMKSIINCQLPAPAFFMLPEQSTTSAMSSRHAATRVRTRYEL